MADEFRKGLEGLEAGPEASPAEGAAAAAPAGEPTHPSILALRERFGDAVLFWEVVAGDEHVVFVRPERILEVLRFLKDDPAQQYRFLSDITGVDYGGGRPIQVVYQLWSLENKRQLRVKAELPLSSLEIESVVPLWHTADWLERETFDMFGIRFRGHPDLRRILMPENYAEGHPLRKDFPLRGRFSRAEQTRRALAMETEDYYTPQELVFMEEDEEPEGPDRGGPPTERSSESGLGE
ncbi:MAG TPA: NADH-quinone oxidoreductase subunit C [Gemmatimonadales bacterium]|nr:NADH-quinone oxidoreductase subunit C [Gemmatimonadales bacterium]